MTKLIISLSRIWVKRFSMFGDILTHPSLSASKRMKLKVKVWRHFHQNCSVVHRIWQDDGRSTGNANVNNQKTCHQESHLRTDGWTRCWKWFRTKTLRQCTQANGKIFSLVNVISDHCVWTCSPLPIYFSCFSMIIVKLKSWIF